MSGLIGGIIGGLGNFFGAQASANGAKEAAKIQADAYTEATNAILAAQEKARLALEAAKARGLGYIDTGAGQYASTIDPLLTARPISQPVNRGLTAQQQLGLTDLRRGINASLSSSGQRGSGRGGVAAGLDAERRYLLSARGANDADAITEKRRAQSGADSARMSLATNQSDTGRVKANTELGTGSQVASSYQAGGTAQGNLLANTGQAYANAANSAGNTWGNFATNTANLVGQGVGGLMAGNGSPNDISSLFGLGGGSGGGSFEWANPPGYQAV